MSNLTGQSLGRYHILEPLGEGGMASVYKAYDTRLETDVAVKIIRVDQFSPAVLEQVLQRFEREAKALARLSHPNIVGIIDFGKHEGVPYLVMEYLPGGTLKQSLGKPVPWQDAARLLLPIGRGLAYAHKRGVVHRDVKPSNILVGDSGEPMLTDFGIAKLLENVDAQTLTGTGVGVGTPEYMAPEQWTGQAGPQSDIYSLGVVFYELITGRKPYNADTPAAILLKQASDPLPRPRQFVPDLPDAVEKVLIKALAKNPEDRYADMGAFTGDLENLQNGQNRTTLLEVKPAQTIRPMDDSKLTNELFDTRVEIPPAPPTPATQNAAPTVPIIMPNPPPANAHTLWPWTVGAVVLVIIVCLIAGGLIIGKKIFPMATITQTSPPISFPSELPTGTLISIYASTLTFSPSASFTLTLPSTPSHSPTIMPVVFLANVNSNCRFGPSTIYPVVTVINAGTSVSVAGKSASNWGEWWQVNSEKGACWVSGSMGTFSGDSNQIMVADAPPTPAPPTITPVPPPPPQLPAPNLISPANNSVFDFWPRTTTLQWTPVAGAVKYLLLREYCQPDLSICTAYPPVETTGTSWTFNFVGAQPGRWRVSAIDSNGREGNISETWYFRYLQ